MSNPTSSGATNNDSSESFADILSDFERSHAVKRSEGVREGRVVSVTVDSVYVDIGLKSEGILPTTDFANDREPVKSGDKVQVTIKGRNPEGYYELTRGKATRPTDWAALEKAFAEKTTILGTVTEVVKGGFSVDIGVRAFMPASRSGARDAAEMQKLVEQEIRCRIIKLDAADEDVVVDRRAVAEEDEKAAKQQLYSRIREGDIVSGTVRSLMDYGAFVDVGGVDALLHVSDISWSRVNSPADVLTVGQALDAKVLKIDSEKQRISIGMKQLLPHPWDSVSSHYKIGERVHGTVTRVTDFGAFVELSPGVEGLIHVSEMSWVKRVRKPSDIVKPGDTVEAVILGLNLEERRMSLGLKQTLGDPWSDAERKFAAGSIVEGPVTSLTSFGTFVQVAEGIEGMVHVSDISAEKRINHPQDVFKVGQTIKAQVLEIDSQKRRLKLGIKQMVPTSIDEYIAEHHEGDVVSGRVMEMSGASAQVQLGEGIKGLCRIPAAQGQATSPENLQPSTSDIASLTSMLKARWKGGSIAQESKPELVYAGQIRSFRITKLDPESKKIDLELSAS
jgi:small subunit ribosomal protein S1